MKNISNKLFHTLSVDETLKELKTQISGLSEEEASERANEYGKNQLEEGKQKSIIEKFIDQFKNLMIIILLIAAVIAGFTHELTDTFIILVVVLINAILGVLQESKAEKALEALKKMSVPYVKVRRNGEVKQIKTENVVPGDTVLLEAGDFVPADMRLIESASLKAEEAALTGESVPVEKNTKAIEKSDIVIGDRKNMVYSSSSISYGRGIGVVTATGMNTEVGRIAKHISENVAEETPLQKKITQLSKYLTIGILTISVIIFLTGIFRGRNYLEMFLTAISLAVAAIPEGLPAVITIVLAMGVQKMAAKNAIIRKLSAVETLGSTEIICSDKTGTLTQNKMTVKKVYINGTSVKGDELSKSDTVNSFIQVLVLCNDSKVSKNENGDLNLIGDPTETALISYADKLGFSRIDMEKTFQRRSEIPFDSERKLMTTINELNGKLTVMTKGAPDILLDRCKNIDLNGNITELDENIIQEIRQANGDMAKDALRVLAVACKNISAIPETLTSDIIENNLTFLGLVGMIDPPREEVKDAVKICSEAGIRPVMITGDHRDTAAAIAKELGIVNDENGIITGNELDKINDEEFEKMVVKYSVYARVSPEHKVRIVKAWKKHGKVVAMTGDGVNDAPALKASDIGVGMGITGTDVAKGVSNMVLADDNFATIVIAVEEGRKIYSNIRKAIQFLLSSNLGEVVTLFVGTMLNWTVLLPIHILWVNLVTDTMPALALGAEKAEVDIMKKKPRKSNESFFAERVGFNIMTQGVIKGLLTLLSFFIGLQYYSREIAITMAFSTLGLIQLTHSLNVRSNNKSLFRIGIFSNIYLTGAIVVSVLLQLGVILIPSLNNLFKVEWLNIEQWTIVFGISISIIPIVEGIKITQNKIFKEEKS